MMQQADMDSLMQAVHSAGSEPSSTPMQMQPSIW
jgi:hypothetical protein